MAILRDFDTTGMHDAPAGVPAEFAVGDFIAPDGQSFRIRKDLWNRAGLRNHRVCRDAYVSDPNATLEPIGLIRPPILGQSTRGLDETRLFEVLKGIRNGAQIPPVPIFREPGNAIATLLDGAHRYFGSVAAGLTRLPCVHVTR